MRILPLLAAAALCACTYDAEKPAIFVQVDGIPQGANRLDVQLTDASAILTSYVPSFGSGTVTSLQLSLAAPANPGAFHLTVDAYDRPGTKLATGSATGALPAAATLQITLATVAGLRGVYGSACDFTAGNGPCAAPNQCEQYVATDMSSSICTVVGCNLDTDCPMTPKATCVVFPGGTTKACQWECTSGGQAACPTNLFCHPVPGTGGKSFCEGD